LVIEHENNEVIVNFSQQDWSGTYADCYDLQKIQKKGR